MRLSHLVNRCLAPFNIKIVRRSIEYEQRSGYQNNHALNEIEERLDNNCTLKNLLKENLAIYWKLVDLSYATRQPSKEMQCELCGHTGLTLDFKVLQSHCRFGGGILIRHQCPVCDVVFGPRKVLDLYESQLNEDYEAHYRVYSEGDSTTLEIRAFHSLLPKKDGIYLNYGAGAWSKSITELRAQGWNVWGYEPHRSARDELADWMITDETKFGHLRFDGVFSNNVLEHFRYPVAELQRIAQFLKEGGRMAHATPCFEYLYAFTRFHLFFFTGRSRGVLATLAGLHIDRFEQDGEFMNLVLSRVKV